MNKFLIVLGIGVGLLVAGCAPPPPPGSGYIGVWVCSDLSPDMMGEEVDTMSVYIMEQGGISLLAETADGLIAHGFTGSWVVNDVGGIAIYLSNGPDNTSGMLLNDGTLLIAGEGLAIKFTRKE